MKTKDNLEQGDKVWVIARDKKTKEFYPLQVQYVEECFFPMGELILLYPNGEKLSKPKRRVFLTKEDCEKRIDINTRTQITYQCNQIIKQIESNSKIKERIKKYLLGNNETYIKNRRNIKILAERRG